MRYGDMVTVGTYIPEYLFEQMEDIRWEDRQGRSAFIRDAIESYVAQTNEIKRQARRRQHTKH